jgi:hypothetical protein
MRIFGVTDARGNYPWPSPTCSREGHPIKARAVPDGPGHDGKRMPGKGCRGHDGERITSRRQRPLVSGISHTGQTHLRRSPEACPRSESMPRFRAFPGGVPVVQRQVFILTHGPLPLTAIFHRLEGNVACASTTRSISTTEIRVKVIPTTEPGKIHRSVVTR